MKKDYKQEIYEIFNTNDLERLRKIADDARKYKQVKSGRKN